MAVATRDSAQDARSQPDFTPELLMRWIVESLYLDEAIPKGALMQWYYQVLTGVKLSHGQMLTLLEATPGVYTDPPVSKKLAFRAVLEEPPPGFQGFIEEDHEEDPVEPSIWDEAEDLLAEGGWPLTEDPLFKYVTVASWLQDASATMKEVSFGRLLQIIRLAVHQRSVLGHRDGLLVPWATSEEHERLANAAAGQPTAVKSNERYVETWDELRDGLRKFIRMNSAKEVEVSKLKLMFRTHLRRELSETVFGYTSMSKLLSDPRLGTDFVLETTPVNGKKGQSTSRLRIILAPGVDDSNWPRGAFQAIDFSAQPAAVAQEKSFSSSPDKASSGTGKGAKGKGVAKAKPGQPGPKGKSSGKIGKGSEVWRGKAESTRAEREGEPVVPGLSPPPGLDAPKGLQPGRLAEGTAASTQPSKAKSVAQSANRGAPKKAAAPVGSAKQLQ